MSALNTSLTIQTLFKLLHVPNTREKDMHLEIRSYLLFLHDIRSYSMPEKTIVEIKLAHYLSYIQLTLKNSQLTFTTKALQITKVN